MSMYRTTLEQIEKRASLLKKLRPAYEEIIDFYSAIFTAQEASKLELDLEPIIIDPNVIKIKVESGMPLISPYQFTIDFKHAKELFLKLCKIAEGKAPKLKIDAENIISALSKNSLDLDKIFRTTIEKEQKYLKEVGSLLNLNEDALNFFALAAVAPSIQTCSVQLSHYINPNSPSDSLSAKSLSSNGNLEVVWKHGYCPICGSPPQLGFFSQDGEKHLVCSLCMHFWKVSRMGCSLCQNQDKEKHQYFFNEEEKEYRVYLCSSCGKYLKFVDLRELARDFYPPIEQLCTLHLDMQATEQGYSSAV
ncbi:MAG: formate dehydrogenase accessory protein FdhE [Desulfamplus sp.]|nr:formate dehydrogenase accessory protein FdhE [Desulfamplus sp.]